MTNWPMHWQKYPRKSSFKTIAIFILASVFASCNEQPEHTSEARYVGEGAETQVVEHAEWSRKSVFYEVNVRNHTAEGTFLAFANDIERIHELGVDVLVLTPIQPIGNKNRTGKRGNPYAIKNFYDTNQSLGSMDEFQTLVSKAHSFGMKVIIDWVSGHTAVDCLWRTAHADFYLPIESESGDQEIHSDVVALDYSSEALHEEMIKAMKFWIDVADIDGFRCVQADLAPVSFWNRMRSELAPVKTGLFFAADSDNPVLHEKAFDMTCIRELPGLLSKVALGEVSPQAIHQSFSIDQQRFFNDAYRLTYSCNYQEIYTAGGARDRLGFLQKSAAVLAFTAGRPPMIMEGQESADTSRISLFEKDTIRWGTFDYAYLYKKLIALRRSNPALINGMLGATYKPIKTNNPENILAFSRTSGARGIVVVINFSGSGRKVTFEEAISGEYQSIFNKQTLSVFTESDISLEAYGFQVFAN